jgi:hypothetical protein
MYADANPGTYWELIASRARIVTAADQSRRHLERDLRDGIQHRLIAVGFALQIARESVPVRIDDLLEVLSGGAQVDQRLACRGQDRPPRLGDNNSAAAPRHQRGADRVGEAMHDSADSRLRHPSRAAQHTCRRFGRS